MGNKKWVPLVFDRDIDAYNEVMAHFTQTILAAHRQWKGNENVAVCQSVPDEGVVPTNEIVDTIDAALHFLRRSDRVEMHGDQTERIDRALEWLQEQRKLAWLATQTKGGE